MASTAANNSNNSIAGLLVDEPLQEEPIRVFLRLRPVNTFELSRRSRNCVATTTAVPTINIGDNGGGNTKKNVLCGNCGKTTTFHNNFWE
mmetsp:Transcript_15390/g.33050  ORF Transcript_15390/g.33050 Transcript_15390/m.33050 type:complete len:90 (-) Transcript_15390:757-1026(-)